MVKDHWWNFNTKFFLFFFLFFSLSLCTTYYVDCDYGIDTNTGMTPTTAFKTLESITQIAFQEGDSYLLKRGCIFKNMSISLSFIQLQNIDNPITLGVYGDINLQTPTLDGSYTFSPSDWIFVRNNIYYAELSAIYLHEIAEIKQVFVNGEVYKITHFPKNYTWFEINQDSNILTEKDRIYSDILSLLPPSIGAMDLVGARVMARSRRWMLFLSNIVSHSTNPNEHIIVEDDISDTYIFTSGSGFVILNKEWMLDENEWFLDTTNNRLYVYFNNNVDLSTVSVKIPSRNKAVYLNRVNNIILENWNFEYFNQGVDTYLSYNVTIRDCSFKNIAKYAILNNAGSYQGVYHITVSNNEIEDVGLRGIYCKKCCYIEGNSFKNIFTNPFMLLQDIDSYGFGFGSAISVSSQDECFTPSRIEGNYVNNTGYANLISSGSGSIVERNFLNNSCLVLDDGCGIHLNSFNHLVRFNIIQHGHGSKFMTGSLSSIQGIRPDDGSGYNNITYNFVNDFLYGVILHNSQGNIVRGNVLMNIKVYGIYFNEDRNYSNPNLPCPDGMCFMCLNVVEYNVFHCIGEESNVRIRGLTGLRIGILDNNWYYRNNTIGQIFSAGISGDTFYDYDFEEWKGVHGYDINSKIISDYYEVVPFKVLQKNESIVTNGNFTHNISDWDDCSSYSNIASYWNSEKQCLENFNDRATKAESDMITRYRNYFPIKPGDMYLIKFTVSSSEDDTISVLVKKVYADYSDVGFNKQIPVSNISKDYSFFFTTTKECDESTFHFRGGNNPNPMHYYVDNLSLEGIIEIGYNNGDDDFTVFINNNYYYQEIFFGENG